MKSGIFLLALSLGLLFGSTAYAATRYVSGKSSVDGKEIAWGGSTKYSSNCSSAISTWNALGKVKITPDTVWTIEDLTFKDVSYSIYYWYGAWEQKSGADKLWMNKYYIDGDSLSTSEKQHVCTHELGHALGLAHSISGNVMYSGTFLTTLGSQDMSDYSYLYP